MRKKISISLSDLADWEDTAAKLGYGPKSKYQLLRKLLAIAKELPALFHK